MSALAQLDRDQLAERTRAGMAVAASPDAKQDSKKSLPTIALSGVPSS